MQSELIGAPAPGAGGRQEPAWNFYPYMVNVLHMVNVLLGNEPDGRVPDFAGPEVRTLGDMAETWTECVSKTRSTV